MKQQWAPQELIDHWTLTAEEVALARNISPLEYNQLGYALMFKCFQHEGRFPQRKQDIPHVVTEQIAQQLHIPQTALTLYNWTGRTQKRHRSHIRSVLGFRTNTASAVTKIIAWLSSQSLIGEDRQFDHLKAVVYERYRNLRIEPPEPKSIDRLIRSALRTADEQFYLTIQQNFHFKQKQNWMHCLNRQYYLMEQLTIHPYFSSCEARQEQLRWKVFSQKLRS